MKDKTRLGITYAALTLFLTSILIAECIPALIVTVSLGSLFCIIAAYAPKCKEKKQPRVRPLYTDWDACYRISQNLPH